MLVWCARITYDIDCVKRNGQIRWRTTMRREQSKKSFWLTVGMGLTFLLSISTTAPAADRLIGLHSAQVMSQSMPWIARKAGLLKKSDPDFNLVFIQSPPVATAATLSGDAEIAVTGAVGNVRAIVQGSNDLVFIGGMKNFL